MTSPFVPVPTAILGSPPSRPHWRQRWISDHALVMAVLFGSAVVVASYLLPGDNERVAMLERDGKAREARIVLEAAYNAGDRRQQRLFQLQGLYEAAGDVGAARRMLEELAAARPRDFALQRQLAQFYRNVQDQPAQIRALLGLIDLRYSEAACRDVVGILRLRGDYAGERSALLKCREKGYRRAEDMIRLASLLAADGNARDAIALLKAADDLRRLGSDRQKLQLFELLLESNQPREAQRRAIRWVRANRDDQFALTFIRALAAVKRHDLGIELAREVSVPGDPVFLAIPELLADQGLTAAAQDLLRGLFEKSLTLDASQVNRFIKLALEVGAPQIAFAGAQRAGFVRLERDVALDLVQSLEASGAEAERDLIRKVLQLEARPPQPGVAELPTGRLTKSETSVPWLPARPDRLAAWRADLWKRLMRENKAIALGERQKTLKSIRRARTVQSSTRRFRPLRSRDTQGGSQGRATSTPATP